MLFNRNRAIDYMRRCNVDVLVATSPVNISYFSDYFCWIDPLFKERMMAPGTSSDLIQKYAVFPLEEDPALIVSPEFATNAADLWIRDIHICGEPLLDLSLTPDSLPDAHQSVFDLLVRPHRNATATDALLSVLHSRRLTDARIGLELEGLSAGAQRELMQALPKADIKDCSNLIRLVRMVKTEEELVRLTRAAEISEKAAMESLAFARPGDPISKQIQHYRTGIAEAGADFDHFMFGVGGLGFALERNYVLSENDVLYVDFGCIYQHYFSDTGITLAMREPEAVLSDKYACLRKCITEAVNTIRPGIRASEVRLSMWKTLESHGITASFPHGHGMGLEVRDYPILVADNGARIFDDCVDVSSDLSLEADMVINLEAMVFMPGVASPHIEQSFLVTAEGSRPLVLQDRTEPLQPNLLK